MSKKFLISLVIFLIFPVFSQEIIDKQEPIEKDFPIKRKDYSDWIEPVNVSKSSHRSWLPQVAANAEGFAYVIWNEEINGEKVYFNTNENGEWGTPKNVSGSLRRVTEGHTLSLFVDKKGIAHIAFAAIAGTFEVFYNKYQNKTLGNNINISETNVGGSVYQSLAVNENNNFIHIVWQDDQNAPPGRYGWWEILSRYKNPNSPYWSNTQIIPPGVHGAYTPDLTIDGSGTAHLVWIKTAFGSSTVYYSNNPDPTNSSGWSTPIAISNKTGIDFCWPKIASDYAGNAYVVWINKSGGYNQIFFRKRINGTWESIENISNSARNSLNPDVAVDKSTGTVYVVWQEKVGDWEIFFKYFLEGQWSQPINITNNSSQSVEPSIWVDDSGEIHVAYSDNAGGAYNIMYTSTKEVAPTVYPPINVSLETKLNSSQTKKINIITWEENPENENLEITNYRIFRKESTQSDKNYKIIATVSGNTFKYEDKNLPLNKKYTYALTSIAKGGYESEISEPVTEEKVFPPINLKLETVINSSLFLDEKINVIKWSWNPLNTPVKITNYKIYRKKKNEDDSQFKLINTVDSETFEYKDRRLQFDENFSYALTAVDNEGNESKKSPTIDEK